MEASSARARAADRARPALGLDLALLQATAARLEVAVNGTYAALDLLFGPGPGREVLLGAYHAAGAVRGSAFPTADIGTWVNVFMRLTIGDLRAMGREAHDPDPWAVFFRLQVALADEITRQHGVKVMLACRRHLTKLAVDWMERTRGRRELQRFIKNSGAEPNRRLAQDLRRHRAARVPAA